MHWSQFEDAQPRLAAAGMSRLADQGVVLIGTVRRDGMARISAVEPLLFNGDLWLAMGLGSHKVADLRRDPRLVVRSIVTNRDGSDGDYLLHGVAREELEPTRQRAYAAEVVTRIGWTPEPGRFHLFWLDLGSATFIRWDDPTNDQFVTRWPPATDIVRRGTSATSQGPTEPYDSGLLVGP